MWDGERVAEEGRMVTYERMGETRRGIWRRGWI